MWKEEDVAVRVEVATSPFDNWDAAPRIAHNRRSFEEADVLKVCKQKGKKTMINHE